MGAVLEAIQVAKSFSGDGGVVDALRGVGLTVDAGEFVAIMGASGSGKSTLLHLIAGLDRPTSGQVTIEGRNLAQMNDHDRTLFRRRRMGMVFQSYNLLPTLTAEENVMLPLLIDGRNGSDIKKRACELLEQVDLTHRKSHRPQAMSGGEQQRVAIARALMTGPAIVLADEPTGNLDTKHGQKIWRLLSTLCKTQHATIVAVTHESAGATFADRVLFLKDGQIKGEISPGGNGHAALVATRYAELAGE